MILILIITAIFPFVGCEFVYNNLATQPAQISSSARNEKRLAQAPSLPEKFILPSVPHNPRRQYGTDCGLDSLRMVLNYYKKGVKEGELSRQLNKLGRQGRRGKHGGLTLSQLALLARQYDLEAYLMFGLNFDILKALLLNGWPPIVAYRAIGDIGHAVVLVGYNDIKKRVLVHDPNFVRVNRIPYQDFLPAWRQFGSSCLLVVPKEVKRQDIISAVRKYVKIEVR